MNTLKAMERIKVITGEILSLYDYFPNLNENELESLKLKPTGRLNRFLRQDNIFFKNDLGLELWKFSKEWTHFRYDNGDVKFKDDFIGELEEILSSFESKYFKFELRESPTHIKDIVFIDSKNSEAIVMRLNQRYITLFNTNRKLYLLPLVLNLYQKYT